MTKSPESEETRERKRSAALRRWANEDRKAHGAKIAEAHAPKCQQRRAERQKRLDAEKQTKAAAKAQKQAEQQAAREAAKQAADAEKQRAIEAKQAEKQQRKQLQPSPLLCLPQSEGLVTLAARQALLHTPAGFAYLFSNKRWFPARHLLYLSEKLSALAAGEITRLVVQSPPRHGKSQLCSTWFPLWYLHHWPHKRIALASYSADLAAMFGRQVRNLAQEHADKLSFRIAPDSAAADRWELVDLRGRRTGGMMVTTGVGGPLTGKGADCLIIDDPHKNAEDANSYLMREKTFEWWTSTAYTRLEPGGVCCMIATRWHEQDLIGKILEQAAREGGECWETVRLPALAETQEIRDEANKSMFLPAGLPDPLGRAPGEALWSARYTAADFARIAGAVGSYVFSSLYQQNPKPAEGNIFKKHWFSVVGALPADCTFVLYFDKAGTEGGQGAQTAGVLMARAPNGKFFVADVVAGRWSAAEREAVIKQTVQISEQRFGRVTVWVEQEPGSGGKESAENTILNLAGYDIHADRPTGDKTVRALPFAAQSEVGNVALLAGSWNYEYLEQLAAFPHGIKDKVDASSGAFNKLALGPALPFSWLQTPEDIAKLPEAAAANFEPTWPDLREKTLFVEEDRWRGIL